MEALGRYYVKKGLEVICIRLGGVTSDNKINLIEEGFEQIYLSHQDLINMITSCIEIETISNNYELFYGVSHNPNRIHNNSNNIGWLPNKVENYT